MRNKLPNEITVYDYSDYCDCEGDHGIDCVLVVPAKRAICGRCNGDGYHTNDAFNQGFTMTEWHEMGHDFQRDQMSGMYDVVCTECKGEKIVVVPDWGYMTPEQRKAADDHYEQLACEQAERDAELRMGA